MRRRSRKAITFRRWTNPLRRMLAGRAGSDLRSFGRSSPRQNARRPCKRFCGGWSAQPLSSPSVATGSPYAGHGKPAQPERKSLFGDFKNFPDASGWTLDPDQTFCESVRRIFPHRAPRPSFPQHAFRPSRFELQTAAKSRPATAQTDLSGRSCPFSTQPGGKTDAENPQVNP